MVASFDDHATGHDGMDAALIRGVASDLRERTAAVAAMAAELDHAAGSTNVLPLQHDVDLDVFADHLAACADVIHHLHRRAS